MRKIFSLLFCLATLSIFAQVQQTFVPVASEVYYFKCQDVGRGRNTCFVGRATGNVTPPAGGGSRTGNAIIQNQAISAGDVVNNDDFGWRISYTTNKGYMIQKVNSALYWKYIGSYSNQNNALGANYICLESFNPAEEDRYYFELRTPFESVELGKPGVSFSFQGYTFTCPGAAGNPTLDAFSVTELGTWNYGPSFNQSYFLMTKQEVANFSTALELDDTKYPFNPVAGKYYYIKTMLDVRGLYHRYVAQSTTADTILNLDITNEAVKNNDYAKWSVELDKENIIYRFKNKATGKYLMFIAGQGEGNRESGLVGTGDINAVGNPARMDIVLDNMLGVLRLGPEGYEEIPSFYSQPYHIGFAYADNQGLCPVDDYDSGNNRVSSWSNLHTDPYVNWLLFTDEDVDKLEVIWADTQFKVEESVYYTIRPNNYSKGVDFENPTAEDLADFENAKNSRLAAQNNGLIYLASYNLENDAIKWEVTSTAGGKYNFKNVSTGKFLTIKKWYAAAGEPYLLIAMDAVSASSYDPSSKNQDLSIDFKGYRIDEYDRLSRAFAILNANELTTPVETGNRRFCLNALDGNSLVGGDIGSWDSNGNGANEQYIIRAVTKDQQNSFRNTFLDKKAKVVALGNEVTVYTEQSDIKVSVYAINGSLVKQTKETQFTIAESGFYIIKVNQEAFKVIVK